MNATDTQTPAKPQPIASVAFLSSPEKSLLASRRPHVARMRAVHQADGEAIVYVGYPEDSGTADERLPKLVRSFGKLVADAAANELKEPSHYLNAKTLPVQVHVFAEDEVPGPSADIFIDERGPKPWDIEVVFDGLNNSRDAAHWVVDVLTSAADQLQRDLAS